MLDNDDFPAEPEHRASDPSIEEMLRRARDAPLDDTPRTAEADAPRFRPFATLESQAARGWLRDCALLVIGVLLGALVACTAVRVGTLVSSVATPEQMTTPNTSATTPPPAPTTTATPLPTPTDTPTPTPTDAPLPTTDEIVALAKDFYDTQGPFAGSYVLLDATGVQVQSLVGNQLRVCIAYEVATVASPDTVADAGTRLFTLNAVSDGTWQVVEIGGAASCSLI